MSSVLLAKLPREPVQEENQYSSLSKKSPQAWATGGKTAFWVAGNERL